MPKPKFQTYNDGVLEVYKPKDIKTDFSAKKNIKNLDDMEYYASFAFSEASKRQEDFVFAEQASFVLSMKVKTRKALEVTSQHKVVIGDKLYDIKYIDPSRTEYYFYLQEVRTLAERGE